MLYATKTYKCLSPSLIFSDPADVCNPKTYFAKRIADSWDRKCPIAAGKYPVSISQYLPEIVRPFVGVSIYYNLFCCAYSVHSLSGKKQKNPSVVCQLSPGLPFQADILF